MEYLDQELDIATQKIKNLEKDIAIIQENVFALTEGLKETQRYLVKLAHNQMELTKRISEWPYIIVTNKEDE